MTTICSVRPHPANHLLDLVEVEIDGSLRQVVEARGACRAGQRCVYVEDGRFIDTGELVQQTEVDGEVSQGVLLFGPETPGFVQDPEVVAHRAFMARHGHEPLTITAIPLGARRFVVGREDTSPDLRAHMFEHRLSRVWGHWEGERPVVDRALNTRGHELKREQMFRAFDDLGVMLRPRGVLPRREKEFHELERMLRARPYQIVVTSEDGDEVVVSLSV